MNASYIEVKNVMKENESRFRKEMAVARQVNRELSAAVQQFRCRLGALLRQRHGHSDVH